MPVGRQGNPVNSQQLQINSGEGVIAHSQMWIIITNTRETNNRKKKRKPNLNLGQWWVLLPYIVEKVPFFEKKEDTQLGGGAKGRGF